MGDDATDDAGASIKTALKTAAEVVDRWGATSGLFTGWWLDPRNGLIGVGIVNDGDDEATRELLQAAVPPSIRVRVRFVSAEWVRLRQLHVRISDYLDDEGIWGRYAVSLGVDQSELHVEVGLLPSTPDSVAAQILKLFPEDVSLDRNASHAIAL